MNGKRYREIISNFLLKIQDLDLIDIGFKQDSATCHRARVTMDLLRAEFGEYFISRLGPVNWPSRSCDLTPLVYFLWVHVKVHVYKDKTASIDALNDNIEVFIRAISVEML